MQAKEEDAPAVLDNVLEGDMQDTEATTDDVLKDPVSQVQEGLLENLAANIQPEADKETKEEVETPDSAPSEEVVEDVPAVEAPVNDQPSQDILEADTKAPEDPVNDQPSQDVSVEEVRLTEAPVQDQPPHEDNEIRPVQTEEVPKRPEESHSRWSLNSIRSSFQNMHGYFDSLVELVGGRNGVCEYRCRHGELPAPRPGYQLPEPNGCSSSLVGFQLDLGIPAMTQCCNQLDSCYDTCGSSKYDCDSTFRSCLHDICSDLKKSLGLGTQVQTCESMADGLFNTVWTLGCRPYMNSQRAACICHGEEKDEL